MAGTKREFINKEVYEFLKNIIGNDFISCELINIRHEESGWSVTEFKRYSIKQYEFKNFLRENKIIVKDNGFQPSQERKNLYRLIIGEAKLKGCFFKDSQDKSNSYILFELSTCLHRFYTPNGEKSSIGFYSQTRGVVASIEGQDLRSSAHFKIYLEGKELIESTKKNVKNYMKR